MKQVGNLNDRRLFQLIRIGIYVSGNLKHINNDYLIQNIETTAPI